MHLEKKSYIAEDRRMGIVYYTGKKEYSIAEIFMDGRYPKSFYAKNDEYDEIHYVIAGRAIVYTKDQVHKFQEGDVFVLPKGEAFYIKAKALRVMVTCVPAGNFEEHTIVS